MAVFMKISKSLILLQLSTFFMLKPTILLVAIPKGTENTNFWVTAGLKRFVLTFVSVNYKLFLVYFLLISRNFGYYYYPPVVADMYGRVFFFYNGYVVFLTAYVASYDAFVFNYYACFYLGVVLASLHLGYISKSFYIFNNFSFRNLVCGYIRCCLHLLAFVYYRFLICAIKYIQAFLVSYSYYVLPVSFCHCDLFRDNVIFYSATCCKLIDFHFLSFEKKLYDVAIFVNEWCFRSSFLHKRFLYFVIAYLHGCFMSLVEFDNLYMFIIFIIFRFFVTRLSTLFCGTYTFSNKQIYSYYYLYNYFYFNRFSVCSFFSLLKRYIYVRFYKRLCFCRFKSENQIRL
ncbi:phosphotransferase [Candidatus Vidania fulgoroideorum]